MQQHQPPSSPSSQQQQQRLNSSSGFDDILQEALWGPSSTPPATPTGVVRSAAVLSPHAPVKATPPTPQPPTRTLVPRPPPTPCSIMDIGAPVDCCASPRTHAVRSLADDFRQIEVAPPPQPTTTTTRDQTQPPPPLPPLPPLSPMPTPTSSMGSSATGSTAGVCTSRLSAAAVVFTPPPPTSTAITAATAATAATTTTASTLSATASDFTPATGLEAIVRGVMSEEATGLLLPEFFGGARAFGGAVASPFELEAPRKNAQHDAATVEFGDGEADDDEEGRWPSLPLHHLRLALGGGCERTLACAPPRDAAPDVTSWWSRADGVARWGNMVLHGPHPEVGEPADELSFPEIAPSVLNQLTDLLLGDEGHLRHAAVYSSVCSAACRMGWVAF